MLVDNSIGMRGGLIKKEVFPFIKNPRLAEDKKSRNDPVADHNPQRGGLAESVSCMGNLYAFL